MSDAGGNDADDDMSGDIVGVETYEAPEPAKKDFLPWHRPRKQLVREDQWCVQIGKLLDDHGGLALDGGTLRYCGLPGSDLLDLRCFHDTICVPRQLKLRFLGFNSAAAPKSDEQIELNISMDEVSKLPQTDPNSEVIPDDFRAVANIDSIAYAKTATLGPFDVVNLDLCDSFGQDEAGLLHDNYYDAVAQLMAIQARRHLPWLLLLTTRVGTGHVHENTLLRFEERYSKNLKDCEAFRNESINVFKIGDESALKAALKTATGLHSVFLTGICKWLLGLAIGHDSSIEVKSVLGYRVEHDAPTTDLVSLAVRVTPHPIPAGDAMQLAQVAAAKPDECALSVKALRRVAKHKDVDGYLAENADVKKSMIENMTKLLELARYDPAAYTVWVADEG